jgi:hypothetical protein
MADAGEDAGLDQAPGGAGGGNSPAGHGSSGGGSTARSNRGDARRHVTAATAAAQALLAAFQNEVADDGEVRQSLVEGETTVPEAIAEAIEARAQALGRAEAVTTRMRDLTERRDRYFTQAETIEGAILRALTQLDIDRIETAVGTAYMVRRPARLVVDDPAELSIEFMHPPRLLVDSVKLRKALEGGADIPGARLVEAPRGLTIRTK